MVSARPDSDSEEPKPGRTLLFMEGDIQAGRRADVGCGPCDPWRGQGSSMTQMHKKPAGLRPELLSVDLDTLALVTGIPFVL